MSLHILVVKSWKEAVVYTAKMCSNTVKTQIAPDCDISFVNKWRLDDYTFFAVHCEAIEFSLAERELFSKELFEQEFVS